MSILIQGMEMPTSCDDCRFCGGIADTDRGPCAWCDVDGKARVADTRQDCPLVPVPPHGRLIDADEIVGFDHQHYEYFSDEYYVTVRDIKVAPTIIEAEEET